MLRGAASKVLWVGRVTVFLVGLAVIRAFVVGVASTALGANGDSFRLGRNNLASAVSTLSKSGAGPALRLEVDRGKPLAVDSSTRVDDLNADTLDGKDASGFAPAGSAPLWVDVNANSFLNGSRGVDGISKGPTGIYNISFNRDVSQCVFVATLADSAIGEISGRHDGEDLDILTWDSAGVAANRPFNLIVVC